jgi:hypothetical protein
MLDHEARLLNARPGLPLITDKGFASKRWADPRARGHAAAQNCKIEGPARPSPLKSVRQPIESVSTTPSRGQLDLNLRPRSLASLRV